MFEVCKKAEVSANDFDCDECLRCDKNGEAHCCLVNCEYEPACPKICAKYRKYKEMEEWDTEKLFDNLQDWILDYSETVPFSFDVLYSRFVPDKEG